MDVFPVQHRGRTAADIQGVKLEFVAAAHLHLTYKGINKFFFVRQVGYGVEVTIKAFGAAEGNVDVQSGGLTIGNNR